MPRKAARGLGEPSPSSRPQENHKTPQENPKSRKKGGPRIDVPAQEEVGKAYRLLDPQGNPKRRKRKGPRIETPAPEEVEEAFRFLDPQGRGFVGQESVVQVFKSLLGREVSEHEVDIMFGHAQIVAGSRRDRIDFPAFQSLVGLLW
jgi:hypothetical protein